MKEFIIYIVITALIGLVSCTKPIILKDAKENRQGIFAFNKNNGNDYYIDIEISDSLELNWITGTHGSFSNSSVIFYDDYLFASDLAGRIYCFLDSTGKEIGAEKYKGEVAVSPLIYGNNILFGVNFYEENYATIFFYDFIKGNYKNKVDIKGSIVNEFIKTDNHFAVLTQNGELIKYDYEGEKIWEYSSGQVTLCTPFFGDDKVYFGTVTGELICIDYNSGSELLRIKVSDRIESTPVKFGNKIIIGDAQGRIICYDETLNKIAWEYDTNAKIKAQPLVINNNILIGNLSGSFYSLKLEDGTENWKLSLGGIFNITPLAFRNLLVQPDMNKKVYIIDHRTGEIVNELDFDNRVRMSPVFYRNKIYFGVDRGDIYSFRIKRL